MKLITIILHKTLIHEFVDVSTFKRVDATQNQASERSQNALSSDVEEASDGILITEYCDRRDSELRRRLKFCISDIDEEVEFDNTPALEDRDYVYYLNVDNDFTNNDAKSVCKKMDTYIKRGAIFDWFIGAGLDAPDSETALNELLDDIVYTLRGRPWGKRPMQPFGPRFYNFYKK